jgi:hypothetical protein
MEIGVLVCLPAELRSAPLGEQSGVRTEAPPAFLSGRFHHVGNGLANSFQRLSFPRFGFTRRRKELLGMPDIARLRSTDIFQSQSSRGARTCNGKNWSAGHLAVTLGEFLFSGEGR